VNNFYIFPLLDKSQLGCLNSAYVYRYLQVLGAMTSIVMDKVYRLHYTTFTLMLVSVIITMCYRWNKASRR